MREKIITFRNLEHKFLNIFCNHYKKSSEAVHNN
jgi:hypothetical protein